MHVKLLKDYTEVLKLFIMIKIAFHFIPSRFAYGVLSLPYAMTSTSSLDDALWVILTKRSAKILRYIAIIFLDKFLELF